MVAAKTGHTDVEAHFERVADWTRGEQSDKYFRGQAEHGGRLWEKPGAFRELLNEVIDLTVYSHVVHEQVDDLITAMEHDAISYAEARSRLQDIFR